MNLKMIFQNRVARPHGRKREYDVEHLERPEPDIDRKR